MRWLRRLAVFVFGFLFLLSALVLLDAGPRGFVEIYEILVYEITGELPEFDDDIKIVRFDVMLQAKRVSLLSFRCVSTKISDSSGRDGDASMALLMSGTLQNDSIQEIDTLVVTGSFIDIDGSVVARESATIDTLPSKEIKRFRIAKTVEHGGHSINDCRIDVSWAAPSADDLPIMNLCSERRDGIGSEREVWCGTGHPIPAAFKPA